MRIKRGDIFWIVLSKYRPVVGSMQKPGRPGIVVSNDANNASSNTVEIVYLTGQPKKELPTHCTIQSSERISVALCEQVTTVSVEQLGDYIGHCTEEEMAAVNRCIAVSLGLQEPDNTYEKPVESADAIKRMETELAVAAAREALWKQLYEDLLTRTLA